MNSSRDPWRATCSRSHGITRAPATTMTTAKIAARAMAKTTSARAPAPGPEVSAWVPPSVAPSRGAMSGSSTRTTTVKRSSTISQPTAMRPCWVSARCGPRERAAGRPCSRRRSPGRARARPRRRIRARMPSPVPRIVATAIWTAAPGTAIARTARRSRNEKWMPTPNISRMTPISASCGRDGRIGGDPRREGADHDARDDVAHDRGQADAASDETADEGGGQADRDGRDENGLVVHGSFPAGGGGAQDWRGSVPERRLGQGGPGRIPDTFTRDHACGPGLHRRAAADSILG